MADLIVVQVWSAETKKKGGNAAELDTGHGFESGWGRGEFLKREFNVGKGS